MPKLSVQYKEESSKPGWYEGFLVSTNDKSILIFTLDNSRPEVVEIYQDKILEMDTSSSEDVLGRIIESEKPVTPPLQQNDPDSPGGGI